MADPSQSQVELHNVLNPGVLHNVRRFWFRHVTNQDHIIVPDTQEAIVWFSQNDDFDQECISNFGAILDFLSSNTLRAEKILGAARPSSPLEWMSLIILLDQIPRNCYRGEKTHVAYRFFDPLALGIAFHAIAAGIPERSEVRYRHSYRFWFYLPLEHSESIGILKMLVREHDMMFDDSRKLADNASSPLDTEVLRCRNVLIKRREQFEIWEQTLREVVKDRMNLIERFGRYPHRNRALCRESTKDELEHSNRMSV